MKDQLARDKDPELTDETGLATQIADNISMIPFIFMISLF